MTWTREVVAWHIKGAPLHIITPRWLACIKYLDGKIVSRTGGVAGFRFSKGMGVN